MEDTSDSATKSNESAKQTDTGLTNQNLDNESEDSEVRDNDIPENPRHNIYARPSLVRKTLYQIIMKPKTISTGTIWDQYSLNVADKLYSGEMVYLFSFDPFPYGSEDHILSEGVQENLYHIININNYLMEMDAKDIFFRRFNFCFEVSRALLIQQQKIGQRTQGEVEAQTTKKVLIGYENSFKDMLQFIQDLEKNNTTMVFNEFLKMYKNMALGIRKLHKKFYHCNIGLESYSVQDLDEERQRVFEEEEEFDPIVLNDLRRVTIKLQSFGDLVQRNQKCKDGALGSRPHEMTYTSLKKSFKHDSYSFAVTILDIEYMYTLKQRPSELLAILMNYFTGPGRPLSDLRKKFANPSKQQTDEEVDKLIMDTFKKELSKNVLYVFLKKKVQDSANDEIRREVLKFLLEEHEIEEEEYREANRGVESFEDLCLNKSIRLVSLTIRELILKVLESVVLEMRLQKHEKEVKKMTAHFALPIYGRFHETIDEKLRKQIDSSLLNVKAQDFENDTLADFYALVRRAFNYKWGKRIPIMDVVNGITSIQIDVRKRLEPFAEIISNFQNADYYDLDPEDPTKDLQ